MTAQVANDERIRTFRNAVRLATEQHGSAEQLGQLWQGLALAYQNRFAYEDAELAYGHAIHLLRDTTLKRQYADSLFGAAQIYVMQSRMEEAQNNLAEALRVLEELGDARSVAAVRDTAALVLLREHRFAEAEAEATATLAELEPLDNPDRNEVGNAYLTRARALAGEGRAGIALDDVARARALATGDSGANRIHAIAILLVQGEVQMQAGLEEAGKQSMTEALGRARALSDLPAATSMALQVSILQREAASLRKAHRDHDAKVLEREMKQVQSTAGAGCGGCTVNVTALLPE